MPTLEELHNAYMRSRDLEDDYEAQQINDYYNNGDEVVELLPWKAVSDSIDDPEEVRWTRVAKKHHEENEDVDAFIRFKGRER